MQSVSILCVLFGAAITNAAPTLNDRSVQECSGSGAYYVCANNGFRGHCSIDPCNKSWCPDFYQGTCETTSCETTTPVPPSITTSCTPTYSTVIPTPTEPAAEVCPGSGAYYVCSNNKFRGYCSVDPCNLDWCPDFVCKTCEKKHEEPAYPVEERDDTVCAPGTGYFQSCGSGFRGCCKADACGLGWCPDSSSSPSTLTTVPSSPAAEKTPVLNKDPSLCAPGTGYFQKCSNGFTGCCTKDACSLGWCPSS
ncbi:hypothetical protein BX600DRAFT_504833 [Xylariales sp. PMI_506]|nr:hypothetical protein BX600DRAFT_504833 [Xylariales sp. PMI_506]